MTAKPCSPSLPRSILSIYKPQLTYWTMVMLDRCFQPYISPLPLRKLPTVFWAMENTDSRIISFPSLDLLMSRLNAGSKVFIFLQKQSVIIQESLLSWSSTLGVLWYHIVTRSSQIIAGMENVSHIPCYTDKELRELQTLHCVCVILNKKRTISHSIKLFMFVYRQGYHFYLLLNTNV